MNTTIPPEHVAEAQRLVFAVLTHIVDHGRAELGTTQSAQLQKANYLLLGKPVPAVIEARAEPSAADAIRHASNAAMLHMGRHTRRPDCTSQCLTDEPSAAERKAQRDEIARMRRQS